MANFEVAAGSRSDVVLGSCCTALLVTALLACGGSTKNMTAADGKQALQIKCKSDRMNCLEEASSSCGSAGYHVLDEESHSGGIAADVLPGPVPWWTMLVRCGQAPVGHLEPPKAAPSVTPLPTVATTQAPQAPPGYRPTASPTQPTEDDAGCSGDFECKFGQKCVKDSLAFKGICATPVNEYGVPQPGTPSGGSLGPGTGNCQFDTQCPIGFKCVKSSGGLYGNCMK
jgi:hypothetical protein